MKRVSLIAGPQTACGSDNVEPPRDACVPTTRRQSSMVDRVRPQRYRAEQNFCPLHRWSNLFLIERLDVKFSLRLSEGDSSPVVNAHPVLSGRHLSLPCLPICESAVVHGFIRLSLATDWFQLLFLISTCFSRRAR